MKYILTETKLESAITKFLDEIFPFDEINWQHPYEFDDDAGDYGEDANRIEFYVGDYEQGDNNCFRWYDCEYFAPESHAREICPTLGVEYYYENLLNSYFGDRWKEPLRKWFIDKFDLPVKTVDL